MAPPLGALHEALEKLLQDLPELEVRAAVVGGLAVGALTDPRFTRDVDVAVSVASDAEAERVVYALQTRGWRVAAALEHSKPARLATVRLQRTGRNKDPVFADLLFASCGIEPEIVAAAQPVFVLEGLSAPVARPGHLAVMKLLARSAARPLDQADLVHLRPLVVGLEARRARDAARLVVSRGFHRRRDLVRHVERYLSKSFR